MPLFKHGDKVIPLKKSFGCKMKNESQWKYAQDNNQPYLYVSEYVHPEDSERDNVHGHYILTYRKGYGGGNHWAVTDLIPYEKVFSDDTLFEMLVKGDITDQQYTHFTSRT